MSKRFFVQHLRTVPRLNADHWSFCLSDGIHTPLILSYQELIDLPSEQFKAAFACSAGRGLIGSASWRGAALSDLLRRFAPAHPYATAYSADGYSASYPLRLIERAFLVYEMDGAPLSPEHGFPARLIVPGCAGYKMPKWVQRIDLTAEHVPGFWEQRGASLDGAGQADASLLGAEPLGSGVIRLYGMALNAAGEGTALEIRFDGGEWYPVEHRVSGEQGASEWLYAWQPAYSGDFMVELRINGGEPRHKVIVRVSAEVIR
jgi:DMSO/TMAO reductase YedYZ molybdopterin-dependent catalytic subunit